MSGKQPSKGQQTAGDSSDTEESSSSSRQLRVKPKPKGIQQKTTKDKKNTDSDRNTPPPPIEVTPPTPTTETKPLIQFRMAFVGNIKSFDPSTDDFEDWELTFNSYLAANDLSKDTDKTKCHGIFLATIGLQNCALLKNLLAPTELQAAKLSDMIKALKSHYKPVQKALAKRFQFTKRTQQQGETAAQFLAALRTIARECLFKTNLEERLRDQFIFGLLSERAQHNIFTQEDDIKLETVVKSVQAMETAERSTAILRGNTPQQEDIHKTSKVRSHAHSQSQHGNTNPKHGNKGRDTNAPSQSNYRKKSNASPQRSASNSNNRHGGKPKIHNKNKNNNVCIRCGSEQHKSFECPHIDKTCNKCQKTGHFAKMCISSGNYTPSSHNVKTVVNVRKTNPSSNNYYVNVTIDGRQHDMEFDTAADMSLLSMEFWERELGRPRLRKSTHQFRGYDGTLFSPIGEHNALIEYNGKKISISIPVVKGDSLFGKDMIKHFGDDFDWKQIARQTPHVKQTKQSNTFEELIKEYSDVFKPPTEQDRIRGFKAKVVLKDDAVPRFLKARPVPYALREKVDQELAAMEKLGVIEKIETSEWASPLVVVPKPNGKVRITGDFKHTVNSQLHVTQYPLALPEDIFAQMHGGKVFSTLDGSNAYHQMELEERCKEFMVINTHRGLYRYQVLPQGISSSPMIFQEFMDVMLRGIQNTSSYIDDTIAKGKDTLTHVRTLRQIFDRMRKFNFKLSRDKCKIGKPAVEFLGHNISSQGLCTTSAKVKAILNMRAPQNVTEIRSFMGLVNFYGRFLHDISSIADPIYKLTRDNVPFNWSTKCQQAFDNIKKKVTTAPILAHFDPELPIGISCDASPIGLGVVLFHTYPDNTERPIAFAARTLDDTERRYSQIEKEGLSIIYGVRKYYKYLCGRKFTLVTDHKPLVSIFGPKNKLPPLVATRLHHWCTTLQEFQYDVVYRKSAQHGNADALSRLPSLHEKATVKPFETAIKKITENLCDILPVTSKKIRQMTAKDPILSRVITYMETGYPAELSPNDKPTLQPFLTRKEEIMNVSGILMWGIRVIIPKTLRKQILAELHQCHIGIVKMKSLARTHVWWPGIDGDIENECGSCNPCQYNKPDPPSAPLHPWHYPERPWQRIHIDLAGPFLNKMWFLIMDAHSKWPEVYPVHGTTTQTITGKLEEVFSRWGLPEQIVSDNGRQFISKEFEAFLSRYNIKHVLSSIYHARSNGEIERFVRTFKQAMKHDDIPIASRLTTFLFKYRSTPHSTTNVSPAELLLGRNIRTVLDLVRPDVQSTVYASQTRQEMTYNKRATERTFLPQQSVWVKTYAKNEEKWSWGTIVAALGPVTFMVDVGGRHLKRHMDQLRSAKVRTRHDDSALEDTSGVSSATDVGCGLEVGGEAEPYNDDTTLPQRPSSIQ